MATFDTGKAFAASAYGPLRFRVIENGVAGDWQPLGTLVRLPVLGDLKCPDLPDQPCKLTGAKLFLVDSVSNDPQFTHPVMVSEGFPGYFLSVPRLTNGELYVRLHDDPSVVNSIIFPSEALSPASIATPPASSKTLAQTTNPPTADNQPSTTSPTKVEQGTPSAPLPQSSKTERTLPVSAADKTTTQSASSTAPTSSGQAPQSDNRDAPSGSSNASSTQVKAPYPAQSAPQRASSTDMSPADDSKKNSSSQKPK